ncbi:ribonuclease E [Mesorhizobium sp. J18]|uniref:Rne/Rng family ribonuclease n=1 Tax=Mesorhizobium sp. J18 TaxID=935263 RepID=UPI00119A56E0|nr:ribonuclease E/G [Mesorhizobium sp. J18]TWG93876.1 ribonuclease E [Mesorhizobium sp. J18]
MPNKMLIDASHPEETRVVVTRGNRIEEFDFESQDKKQLRGNIYLARVTRVEPSLQAAFVEYGGNRHGFLAFSEIHPDYYQIPVADRQAILQAEAEQVRAEDENGEEEEERSNRGKRRRRSGKNRRDAAGETLAGEAEQIVGESIEIDEASAAEKDIFLEEGETSMAAVAEADLVSEEVNPPEQDDRQASEDDAEVDTVGAEDALDEVQNRRKPVRRTYKIQEVIKRRQILLVQVVKEERGNKGAALTTYLSLAGRYSVLMPNTARGGGISRKITNPQDRKRLKEIVRELEVPEGMGVILRTAGANRTRAEIKRDYDYLMRLWERVRNLTLESTAPALVYEEGSLIKRSVRDLYNKDIDEILVAGEEGYREAKDFMRMLMPSHAKVVQPYRDTIPIFARNGIEAQLDKMLQPQVTLKSGGYIIINQTEALVAIDVNSGRSTKEHSIEDTALQTNLEAAEEVARQLRLRDLAGLIVIDFIDMEENRNNRAVEKRLKDCLKNDRARIQVGRISHFGLLEMSRQRIRASVLESTMQPCPHCGGTGHVRSESSVALLVVRAVEEHLLKDNRNDITVRTPASTALYILNHKRSNLVALEDRFGVTITVEADDTVGSQYYTIIKGPPSQRPATIETPAFPAPILDEDPDEADADAFAEEAEAERGAEADDARDRKKRRRRRRRGGRDRDRPASEETYVETAVSDLEAEAPQEEVDSIEASDGGEATEDAAERGERKKRRRGKRGGKRNRREDAAQTPEEAGTAEEVTEAASEEPAEELVPAEAAVPVEPVEVPEPAKKPARRTRKSKTEKTAEAESSPAIATEPETPADASQDEPESAESEAKKRPAPARRKAAQIASEPVVSSSDDKEDKPRKTGWWQRKGFF